MASVATQLKDLRQQVEALQVEVAGRQHISSMVIWDEQKQPSVNQKSPTKAEQFNGLIVHLTSERSPLEVTVNKRGNETHPFE